MEENSSDSKVLAAIAVTLVLWSSAFAVIRGALATFGPGHLAILRFGTALAALFLVVAARSKTLGWPRVARQDWKWFVLAGVLGTTLYHALLNWGEVEITAGAASFLIMTAPMWGLLFAPLIGERAPRGAWPGVALSLAGVFLIASGEEQAAARLRGMAEPSLVAALGSALAKPGALLVLGAAFAGGASGVVFRKLLRAGAPEEHMTFVTTAIGLAFLLPFGGGLGDAVRAAPWQALGSAVYLGLFPTAVAYLTWSYALKRWPVTRVTPFIYAIPVLATFLAWLLLREVPSALTLCGGAIALCGVVLAQKRK